MTALADSGRPAAWSASEKKLLAALIVGALVVRVVCFEGLMYLDSMNYANVSLDVVEHGVASVLGFHQNNRLGMVLPPAALFATFGPSEAAAIGYFSALSLLELLFVPLLLARLFEARVVLVATALYAFTGLAIRSATTNSADMAVTVYANFAFLLLLTAAPERRVRTCAVAGFLIGVACLHKETAVVLGPAAAVAAVFAARDGLGPRTKRLAALGVGFLAPLVVEALLFKAWTGDPIYRYRHVKDTHGPSLAHIESGSTLARFVKLWPSNLLESPLDFGVLVFVLPGAVIAHVLDRFRTSGGVLAFWFLFPALYTVFGTSVVTGWHPLMPFPRYLEFTLLPASILAAQALLAPTDGWARRLGFLVPAAGCFVVACLLKTRGTESVVAGVAGLALAAAACRREPPSPRFVLCGIALFPATLVVERALGRTETCWAPERRGVAIMRDLGAKEMRSTTTTYWALRTMSRLGQLPGVTVERLEPHDGPAAVPAGAAVLVLDADARAVAAIKDASGAPAYEEKASFLYPQRVGEDHYHVFLRRGAAR